MFIAISMGEIITLPFGKKSISLYIEETRPEPVVSIYEIEEIEIDLLPMDEYKNKSATMLEANSESEIQDLQNSENLENIENKNIKNDSIEKQDTEVETSGGAFVPFSGKGNRLGSS